MTRDELAVLADAAFRGALVATKPTLSVEEGALLLGISTRYVRALIAEGRLRVQRLDTKKIVINRADLLALPKYGPAPAFNRRSR